MPAFIIGTLEYIESTLIRSELVFTADSCTQSSVACQSKAIADRRLPTQWSPSLGYIFKPSTHCCCWATIIIIFAREYLHSEVEAEIFECTKHFLTSLLQRMIGLWMLYRSTHTLRRVNIRDITCISNRNASIDTTAHYLSTIINRTHLSTHGKDQSFIFHHRSSWWARVSPPFQARTETTIVRRVYGQATVSTQHCRRHTSHQIKHPTQRIDISKYMYDFFLWSQSSIYQSTRSNIDRWSIRVRNQAGRKRANED